MTINSTTPIVCLVVNRINYRNSVPRACNRRRVSYARIGRIAFYNFKYRQTRRDAVYYTMYVFVIIATIIILLNNLLCTVVRSIDNIIILLHRFLFRFIFPPKNYRHVLRRHRTMRLTYTISLSLYPLWLVYEPQPHCDLRLLSCSTQYFEI